MVNQERRRLVEFVLEIVIGDCMYIEWKEIEFPNGYCV